MLENLDVEQLKKELTKRGVKFHHLAGVNKLSELWAIHSKDVIVEEEQDTDLLNDGFSTDTPPVKPKGKYKALRNVKHNGIFYKSGCRYDIEKDDAEELILLKYIKK